MAYPYRLLAIDLDGTLLDSASRLSPANRAAVVRAIESGLEVVVCTGRGLAECRHVLDDLSMAGAAVVAGGAMTVELPSGATLHRSAMPADLVRDVARILNAATGHYVLLLKDRSSTGVDYILLSGSFITRYAEERQDRACQGAVYETLLDTYPVIETFDAEDASLGPPVLVLEVGAG